MEQEIVQIAACCTCMSKLVDTVQFDIYQSPVESLHANKSSSLKHTRCKFGLIATSESSNTLHHPPMKVYSGNQDICPKCHSLDDREMHLVLALFHGKTDKFSDSNISPIIRLFRLLQSEPWSAIVIFGPDKLHLPEVGLWMSERNIDWSAEEGLALR